MKVRVVLSIEVDADEWAEQYGTGTAAREVATDVKEYVLYAVQQAPAPLRAEVTR